MKKIVAIFSVAIFTACAFKDDESRHAGAIAATEYGFIIDLNIPGKFLLIKPWRDPESNCFTLTATVMLRKQDVWMGGSNVVLLMMKNGEMTVQDQATSQLNRELYGPFQHNLSQLAKAAKGPNVNNGFFTKNPDLEVFWSPDENGDGGDLLAIRLQRWTDGTYARIPTNPFLIRYAKRKFSEIPEGVKLYEPPTSR